MLKTTDLPIIVPGNLFDSGQPYLLLGEDQKGRFEGHISYLGIVINKEDLLAAMVLGILSHYRYPIIGKEPIEMTPSKDDTYLIHVPYSDQLFPDQSSSVNLVLWPLERATQILALERTAFRRSVSSDLMYKIDYHQT